jgi:hypothetical protein
MTAVTLPEIIAGMDALRRDNPWPELPAGVEPFYLSLDAGGRHLVVDAIREHGVTLMLEIGCFLCGSTRQWLDSSPDLEVIGVDPWDGNWSTYVRKGAKESDHVFAALEDPDALADTIQRYGNYCLALNNIRDQRERFTPVRQRSPEALHYLRRRGIEPQLIYIDAFKSDEDLWVAHELFPRSILCGDDWNWADEHGCFRMREHVERFAGEQGFTIAAEAATWLLSTGRTLPPRAAPWDASAARALIEEMDSTARALLRLVSAGASVTFDEAGRRLGLGPDDLLLAIRRVNEADAADGRPQALGLGGTGHEESEGIGTLSFVLAEGLAPLVGSVVADRR